MAKKKTVFNFNMIGRPLINIVVAGFIFSVIGGLIAGFGDTTALIISGAVLLFIIPTILRMRPGAETMTSLILAIPLGTVLIGLLNSLFGIVLPGLENVGGFGTLSFALAFASYFTADWLYLMFLGRRKRR